MKWVRCPSCRTITDVDGYGICEGCAGDLAGVPELKPKAPRVGALEREAARDMRAGDRVIWVLVGLCVVSLIAIFAGGDETMFLAIPTIPAVIFVLWLVMTRPLRRMKLGSLERGILYGLALLGAGVGGWILLMLACSPFLELL